MKLLWPRLLPIAGALPMLPYLGDYISIEYRIPNGRDQFGSVEVQNLLAIPQKDRKIEYITDPSQEQRALVAR